MPLADCGDCTPEELVVLAGRMLRQYRTPTFRRVRSHPAPTGRRLIKLPVTPPASSHQVPVLAACQPTVHVAAIRLALGRLVPHADWTLP
jgi:hypothetical protein